MSWAVWRVVIKALLRNQEILKRPELQSIPSHVCGATTQAMLLYIYIICQCDAIFNSSQFYEDMSNSIQRSHLEHDIRYFVVCQT